MQHVNELGSPGLGMLLSSLSSLAPIIGFGVWKGMLLRSERRCYESENFRCLDNQNSVNDAMVVLCFKLFKSDSNLWSMEGHVAQVREKMLLSL